MYLLKGDQLLLKELRLNQLLLNQGQELQVQIEEVTLLEEHHQDVMTQVFQEKKEIDNL